MEDDGDGLGQKSRRSHFWQFLNDNCLHVPEGTQSVFERKRVVVVIVGFDEPGFAWFEVFLGVEVVGVLLHLVTFGLFAVVDTFFQVVLDDVHFGDYALKSY